MMEILHPKPAVLVLEDGTLFHGHTCGIDRTVWGEVVFNTSPTGYQEICTDPSYANQIVLFTSPHIGNVGINQEDDESKTVWVKGIIVLEMSKKYSNWRGKETFINFLKENQIPWIEGIDTRKLTRHLRAHGVKNGCLITGESNPAENFDLTPKAVKEHPDAWCDDAHNQSCKRIIVYDFGVKSNILKKLSNLSCSVMTLPCTYTSEEILSWQPDGIVISNGPGDPAMMQHGIQETKKLILSGVPIFGICLGCQLIALASGGKTRKMKFGHHGTNHPVYDLRKGKTFITSQNHNFTIDDKNCPSNLIVTHQSLFDGSIQGIRLKGLPIFGFQGHPEGSPGPQDLDGLFEEFLQSM